MSHPPRPSPELPAADEDLVPRAVRSAARLGSFYLVVLHLGFAAGVTAVTLLDAPADLVQWPGGAEPIGMALLAVTLALAGAGRRLGAAAGLGAWAALLTARLTLTGSYTALSPAAETAALLFPFLATLPLFAGLLVGRAPPHEARPPAAALALVMVASAAGPVLLWRFPEWTTAGAGDLVAISGLVAVVLVGVAAALRRTEPAWALAALPAIMEQLIRTATWDHLYGVAGYAGAVAAVLGVMTLVVAVAAAAARWSGPAESEKPAGGAPGMSTLRPMPAARSAGPHPTIAVAPTTHETFRRPPGRHHRRQH